MDYLLFICFARKSECAESCVCLLSASSGWQARLYLPYYYYLLFSNQLPVRATTDA